MVDPDGRGGAHPGAAADFAYLQTDHGKKTSAALREVIGITSVAQGVSSFAEGKIIDGAVKVASAVFKPLKIGDKLLKATQKAVSGPQVDRLAEDMKVNGFDSLSPVKVDGDLVVDGHHRVMAAKKADVDIVTTPGTASPTQKANVTNFEDVKVDPVDWYQ